MDALRLEPWGRIVALAIAVVLVALLAHRLLRPVVFRLSGYSTLLGAMVRRCDPAVRWLLPLVALQLLWQAVPEELPGLAAVEHSCGVLTIACATWLAMAAIQGLAEGVITLHPSDIADNLQARRIQTQTRVLSRIASGAALIAGVAFILMTFPRARQLGASLLASAGVAGLVLGLAARSLLGNLIAGLQIALAQPLRLDDVLIVEGEWGRVEEITATYVVIKVWDERRLVVPLQWFIEHPFQNWTRRGAELLGTVFLWVDYTLPLEPLRAEARRLCEAAKEWDGRVCLVQVTDANERAMQLRILVSSADAGRAFDLRCILREGLIGFIHRHHGGALPRLRGELDGPTRAPGALREPAPGSAPA
jgi:small-conductance mechanosensitive channel